MRGGELQEAPREFSTQPRFRHHGVPTDGGDGACLACNMVAEGPRNSTKKLHSSREFKYTPGLHQLGNWTKPVWKKDTHVQSSNFWVPCLFVFRAVQFNLDVGSVMWMVLWDLLLKVTEDFGSFLGRQLPFLLWPSRNHFSVSPLSLSVPPSAINPWWLFRNKAALG